MNEYDTLLVVASAGIATIIERLDLYFAFIYTSRGQSQEAVAEIRRIDVDHLDLLCNMVQLLAKNEEMLRWWLQFYTRQPIEGKEHGKAVCYIGLYRLILEMSREDQEAVLSIWNEIKDLASEKYMP